MFIAYIGSLIKQLIVGKIIGIGIIILKRIGLELFEPGKIAVDFGSIILPDRNGKIVKIYMESLANSLGFAKKTRDSSPWKAIPNSQTKSKVFWE